MADERGARDGVPQTLRETALETETYKKNIYVLAICSYTFILFPF